MTASRMVKGCLVAASASSLLTCLSLYSCGTRQNERSDLRIVNGRVPAADSPAALSTVFLGQQFGDKVTAFCSGTLVAQNLVVTAAHCIENETNIVVGFGASDVAGTYELRQISAMKSFKEDFSSHFPNFDIAWVKLKEEAPSNSVPARILADINAINPGHQLLLAGYGKTSTECEDNCSGTKLEVDAMLKEKFDEPHMMSVFVTQSQLNSGTCNGDSGGSAFAKVDGAWALIGDLNGLTSIINPGSFNGRIGRCEAGEADYNSVSDYVPWIEETSGVQLSLVGERPPQLARVLMPRSPRIPDETWSLKEWLAFDDHTHPAWRTVELMTDFAISKAQNAESERPLSDFYRDADLVSRHLTEGRNFNLGDSFFRLDSELKKAGRLPDLRPLSTLKNIEELVLNLSADSATLMLKLPLFFEQISRLNLIIDAERLPLNFLKRFPNTEHLTLRLNSNKSKSLPDFSEMPKLTRLDLAGNGLRGEISVPQNLKFLELRANEGAVPKDCPVGAICRQDRILEPNSMEEFCTNLDEPDFPVLSPFSEVGGLAQFMMISSLNIFQNISANSCSEALVKLSELKELRISGLFPSFRGETFARMLVQKLQKLEQVDLWLTSDQKELDVSQLRGLPSLVEIGINGNAMFTQEPSAKIVGLGHVLQKGKVKKLRFRFVSSDSLFGVEGLGSDVASFDSLEELFVFASGVTTDHVNSLNADFPSLKDLNLMFNNVTTAFKTNGLHRLESLNLIQNPIQQFGFLKDLVGLSLSASVDLKPCPITLGNCYSFNSLRSTQGGLNLPEQTIPGLSDESLSTAFGEHYPRL